MSVAFDRMTKERITVYSEIGDRNMIREVFIEL